MLPMQIARILHQSKNLIYEKLKKGEIPYYPVHGKCLIGKANLIDYIIEYGEECTKGRCIILDSIIKKKCIVLDG